MRRSGSARRLPVLAVVVTGAVISLGAQALVPAASASTARPAVIPGHTKPRPVGMLDCNGLSPIQRPAKLGLMCADPRGPWGGRFYENGHYIGHDEPSVRFLSNRRGSGNNVTMTERLPRDPSASPTVRRPGHDVTHWFELSVAPWLSITVCDPNSAPLAPCKPRSDSNAPHGKFSGGGAAFVELQFYPPGFAPFDDNISCDNSHWCSALNIDSLECTGNGSGPCNNDCVEPVNFGWVQRNGVPTGPPSPQLSNLRTFSPNRQTLRMRPGDLIRIHMFDAKIKNGHALEVRETDVSTGQSGFMIASGANGFKTTNPFTCKGHGFNFQPEYNTAGTANIIPWGIGPYMINNQFEVGHFEPCTSVSGKAVAHLSKTVTDVYYKTCHGPYEKTKDSGAKFEPNDSPCFRKGDTHGGLAPPNIMTGCPVFFDAIGDLDYDGTPYYRDWPDSLKAHRFPSPFLAQTPTTGGHPYPRFQFMTDTSATEFNTKCNLVNGKGCVMPPKGPGHFYPYWTLARVHGQCAWEFGNMTNGAVYGKDKQYGTVRPDTMGAFVGPVLAYRGCGRA
jgi:hypothetical protein